MPEADSFEQELKELIVDALALKDVQASDIGAEDALFGTGLGLDSIDALELAMVVFETYGVDIPEDPDEARGIFASVRSLGAHISSHRPSAGASK